MEYTYNGILFNLKKKEILTHATTWMSHKDMLSEIIQTQKDKYCLIPLPLGKFTEAKVEGRFPEAGGSGE